MPSSGLCIPSTEREREIHQRRWWRREGRGNNLVLKVNISSILKRMAAIPWCPDEEANIRAVRPD
jgi:hypothetical protein